jgi:SP family xylose:H+ symportor-like MFS transporter
MPEMFILPVGKGDHTILPMFVLYRILGGVGVGLASMLSPLYIGEIAPSEIRGKLVSWNQFAIITGMLIVYFVNYLIALSGDDAWLFRIGWRWMFASELIPAGLFFLLLLMVPETPRYLALKGKPEDALSVLRRIHGNGKSGPILEEIKQSLSTVKERVKILSFGPLVLAVGILLAVFQQFIGINVVMYYAPEIFRNLGAGTDTALLQTISVGAINMIFTVLAIFTVDRIGRKPLQVAGALGMAVFMVTLGFSFYTGRQGMLAMVAMLGYVACFSSSWGPVTWVLLSEIFPNLIRGRVMALAVAAMWISNLIISWTFPVLNNSSFLIEKFNHGFAYWIYGIVGIFAAIFIIRFVPETRKRTLEEIEKFWKKSR